MTKDEVKKIFMLLTAAYPTFLPDGDDERKAKLNLWELMFSRNSYWDCEWAAQRCIETCVFPPTVADMKQWLGANRHEEPKLLAMPEPKYSNAAYIEAMFEKAMRKIDEVE